MGFILQTYMLNQLWAPVWLVFAAKKEGHFGTLMENSFDN